METLIELANQYRKEMGMSLDWHTTWGEIFVGDYGSALSETVLVSRNYWFIQRLVENDKIDYDKIGEKIWIETHKAHFPVNKYWYVYDLELGDVSSADYSDYESLLMLLSISDTPIDDLLLYLK